VPPPRVLLVYHFFHPDEVVSARLFSDLGAGLVRRGWDVTALTSERSWGQPGHRYSPRESWQGVEIRRASRPAWDQSRPAQRLLNSAWMMGSWLASARSLSPFDAVVLGSDPAFAALMFLPLRRMWPSAVLTHWCYDVYPDAIAADGSAPLTRWLVPAARALMETAYGQCDAIVDLGPRMRARLAPRDARIVRETLVPWALTVPPVAPRPPAPAVREQLFGTADLGLLYSGTLGRAHDFRPFLQLARASRGRYGDRVAFSFAGRGQGVADLLRSLEPSDTNVRISPFSAESELLDRLESADVHLLSLRDDWSGIVVPSKFFGSLAVGRPILYAGPADSDIAHWIRTLNVGWDAAALGSNRTLDLLDRLLSSPADLKAAQARARAAYDAHFGKDVVIDRWDSLLRRLIAARGMALP
jgi:colanic acid biosynthesis glycosyl transferase WcaI